MSRLLKALFNSRDKPKIFSEKASLASLTPLAGSPPAQEARQAIKSVEKFSARRAETGWLPESFDAERRFRPAARKIVSAPGPQR